jgi:hypothetical protein
VNDVFTSAHGLRVKRLAGVLAVIAVAVGGTTIEVVQLASPAPLVLRAHPVPVRIPPGAPLTHLLPVLIRHPLTAPLKVPNSAP